eukprot:COSAG02_NODE_474_length_21578_cov_225.787746_6_plen_291_part_00
MCGVCVSGCLRVWQVTCVARNAPKANFLTCVTGGVTVSCAERGPRHAAPRHAAQRAALHRCTRAAFVAASLHTTARRWQGGHGTHPRCVRVGEAGPRRDPEDLREGAEQPSHADLVRSPCARPGSLHGCIYRACVTYLSLRDPCLSLWSHDGYRLFDKADILPLVDQDSHIIACDKETFPSDAMSRKRSAADAEDDVSASTACLPRRPPPLYLLGCSARPPCIVRAAGGKRLGAGRADGCAHQRRRHCQKEAKTVRLQPVHVEAIAAVQGRASTQHQQGKLHGGRGAVED